jgi:hypothetical protein
MFNRAKAAFTSMTQNTRYTFSTAMTFVIGSSMAGTADALTCMGRSGFFMLNCGDGEEHLVQTLQNTCGVIIERSDACDTPYLAEMSHYGSGTFGGSCCELSYPAATPEPCVDRVLSADVGTCFGSVADIFATIGIIIGGLTCLVCLGLVGAKVAVVIMRRNNNNPDQQLAEVPIEQMLNEHLVSLENAGQNLTAAVAPQAADDVTEASAPLEDEEDYGPGNPGIQPAGVPRRSLLASANRLFGKSRSDQPGVAMATRPRMFSLI